MHEHKSIANIQKWVLTKKAIDINMLKGFITTQQVRERDKRMHICCSKITS